MGAGDQGVMTGYACSETKQFLPLPVVLAHRIVRELSACRISEYIQGLLPDGKAQVTVEYEDGKPVRLDTVIVSCQHVEEKSKKDLEREIRQKVLRPALRMLPPDEDTRILINPSGKFVVGGLDADTGLTGREINGGLLWKHSTTWRRCLFWKRRNKSGSVRGIYGKVYCQKHGGCRIG